MALLIFAKPLLGTEDVIFFFIENRVSFGNFLGLTLVDYAQKKVIATMMTYELGGK